MITITIFLASFSSPFVAQLEAALAREASAAAETKQMFEKCLALEKEKTSFELELKAMTTKYEQEAKALREADSPVSPSTPNHESSTQLINSKLPTKILSFVKKLRGV